MKQKIVIKVPTIRNQKLRAKAMKIVVGVNGVESASLAGPDKTQIEVIGNGIDSVEIVCLLRKKFRYADLDTVAPVEEKKKDDKKNEHPQVWQPSCGYYGYPLYYHAY
ncbi:Heavy metal-associated isoprenylated plant protein 46 [Linum perenne]